MRRSHSTQHIVMDQAKISTQMRMKTIETQFILRVFLNQISLQEILITMVRHAINMHHAALLQLLTTLQMQEETGLGALLHKKSWYAAPNRILVTLL